MRSRPFSARRNRAAAGAISFSPRGSGRRSASFGSRKRAASAGATPRATSTRAKAIGRRVCCTMASASRSASIPGPTQRRPVAEASTFRKARGAVSLTSPGFCRSSAAPSTGLRPHQDGFGGDEARFALHPLNDRPVGDAGRSKDHVAGHHFIARIDAVQVGDPGLGGARPRSSSLRNKSLPQICPPMHFSADSCQHPFGRRRPSPIYMSMPVMSASAQWMTPATSPSVISRIEAPVERTSAIIASWRGRSRMQQVMSLAATPLALARARTRSAGAMARLTTSLA